MQAINNLLDQALAINPTARFTQAEREILAAKKPFPAASRFAAWMATCPTLVGSDKQVAWAKDIREAAGRAMMKFAIGAAIMKFVPETQELFCASEKLMKVFSSMLNTKSAKTLIEHPSRATAMSEGKFDITELFETPAAKLPVCKASLMRYAHSLRRGGMSMGEALKAAWAAYKAA